MPIKRLSVSDFASKGLNTDLQPWNLPAGFLTDMNNVRVANGDISPFGGSLKFEDLPTIGFTPGFIFYINSTLGKYFLITGLATVYAYSDGTFSDITVVGGHAGITQEELWTGCALANIPVLNNPGTYPQYWSPQSPATRLTYLPWDAIDTWQSKGESCRIMRSHKQFLFALDLFSSTYGEVPDGVRWSSPADINGVPESWDELDVTNVAGLTTLGGTGGRIVDGLGLRDSFVVYRESAITVFDYVPNSPYVWRIRELISTVGAVAPDSIVEVKGLHYFIGDGDIFVNDGNRVNSIMHKRIRKKFLADYNPEFFRNSFAVKNTVAYEVWFCIPGVGSEFPTRAYIYNWRDDTWAVRDIPETPMATYGVQDAPVLIWSEATGSWLDSTLLWDVSSLSPQDDTLVCVTRPKDGNAGELRFLDQAEQATEPFDTYIERTGFALEGLSGVTTITNIYPRIQGPGFIRVRIGSQDYPSAPIRWKPSVNFYPDLDRKISMRTTGELHCFRFYTESQQSNWSLAGMDIEYVDAGLR